MSKGLEAFERLKEGDSPSAPRDIEIVEKELKALEIITRVMELNVNWAKQLLGMGYLTQEEYDLLKEVLLCQ